MIFVVSFFLHIYYPFPKKLYAIFQYIQPCPELQSFPKYLSSKSTEFPFESSYLAIHNMSNSIFLPIDAN